MKALLVGFLFLVAVLLLSGLGILLFPFFIILAFFLRIVIGLLFIVFCVWLLGKFIIFVWEKVNGK